MTKRAPKINIDDVLAVAARLPKGPALRVGKHITGGRLTLRYLVPMNDQQEKALAAMLEKHSTAIIDESAKILGVEVRSL